MSSTFWRHSIVCQLEEAGIKRVINGPMIWSPDANALLGPVPELENYYCANGIIPGFSQSAGLGLTLAQWIVEGEPELDMFPWDVTRFGAFADKAYTKAKVADSYMNRFKIHFPFEERSAGRPVMTRPGYERQKELGGVFGFSFGYEHSGTSQAATWSMSSALTEPAGGNRRGTPV